jgi:hypothetical protein
MQVINQTQDVWWLWCRSEDVRQNPSLRHDMDLTDNDTHTIIIKKCWFRRGIPWYLRDYTTMTTKVKLWVKQKRSCLKLRVKSQSLWLLLRIGRDRRINFQINFCGNNKLCLLLEREEIQERQVDAIESHWTDSWHRTRHDTRENLCVFGNRVWAVSSSGTFFVSLQQKFCKGISQTLGWLLRDTRDSDSGTTHVTFSEDSNEYQGSGRRIKEK